MMVHIPAIREGRGITFNSGFELGGGSATMMGNRVGCPQCGALVPVPDDVISITDEVVQILRGRGWTRAHLQHLGNQLEHLRRTTPDRSAVMAA